MYGHDVLSRSLLYKDGGMYLTPAPGTLTPGYLIVAPVRHESAIAALREEELCSLARIVDLIREVGRERGLADYVAFEHGMLSPMRRGATCVAHAHLHLCPSPSPGELHSYLQKWYAEESLKHWVDLPAIREQSDAAYLLLQYEDCGTDAPLRTYRVGTVTSQLLRQRLARQWGVGNAWDWRAYPHSANFLSTLDIFEGRLPR